ncbi:2OG-Fe(II) oxygenase [Gallaecimonas kandeliae]|uniref:2OG-Fe(II) oxygenase n=1 Tax=Gallaecimonas kandeliae TaxID=3029055 RepID=UPI002647DFAD|nr:2OG-Fe(II) oxygenase [Gallaecimonas kandeliae]WKE64039.1 2OG-Fe(II) oxygenase [Gallaecimonas kandeliae]
MSIIKTLFRWQKGRQQSGYEKMLLAGATWPVKFDLYLLRFPEGCEVPPHRDAVQSGKHFRLNIVLKKAKEGGDFICQSPIYCSSRIKFFRPDLCGHSVSKVVSGNRYLLSLGWIRKD